MEFGIEDKEVAFVEVLLVEVGETQEGCMQLSGELRRVQVSKRKEVVGFEEGARLNKLVLEIAYLSIIGRPIGCATQVTHPIATTRAKVTDSRRVSFLRRHSLLLSARSDSGRSFTERCHIVVLLLCSMPVVRGIHLGYQRLLPLPIR